MSLCSEELDKHYILDDFENKLKRKSSCWSFKSGKTEEDKRARREVANNNERRRMQSINDGFENLRRLLPHCLENEKISKASILQTTAKYIIELQTRINCLENDILQSNPDKHKCTLVDIKSSVNELDGEITKNAIDDSKPLEILSYQGDLGSSTSSLTTDNLSSSTLSLKSCDTEPIGPAIELSESINDNYQPQSTLEYLLAAVAQVERQEALQNNTDIGNYNDESRSQHISDSTVTVFDVMKPTISPYAEKIIQDAVNMSRPFLAGQDGSLLPLQCSACFIVPENGVPELQRYRSTKISIPHKYLHRPDVVLSRSNHL